MNILANTVLIVDDEKDLVELLAKRLIANGHKVLCKYDSESALLAIEEDEIGLVISDINLPGKSGLELLKWMKDMYPLIPVVLITGFLDENDAKDAVDQGCFGFLAKPVSKKDLLRVVENALDQTASKISEMDFARIPIDDFIAGNVINFPVYVKLHGERFLKVAHTGNEISLERIKKFKEDHVRELWIDKDDLESYLELCQKIYEASTQIKSLAPHRRIALLKHSSEVIYEKMRVFKVSPEIIVRGVDNLTMMFTQLTSSQKLGSLIYHLHQSNDLLFSKSIIEATLCGLVARALDWQSQTNIMNVMIASFMKDVGIKELPEEVRSLKIGQMNKFQFEVYQGHVEETIKLIKDKEGINESIIQIIQHHHEDGTPNGYPNKIPFGRVYPPAVLVRIMDQFFEKYSFYSQSKESFGKSDLLRIIDNLPQNATELNFCKALKVLFKSQNINEAISTLAK